MSVSSGLGAYLTLGEELVSYGTLAAALTRAYDFDSETMQFNKTTAQGMGLRNGALVPRASRRNLVFAEGGGDVTMDIASKGMGLWFKHALGATTIAQQGATAAWLQTFTPGDLRGKSFTMQTSVPDVVGTAHPFNWLGCKITDWEIGVDNKDNAKFKASIDAKDCDSAATPVTPDYTLANAANVFHFAEAAMFVAGSGTAVIGNPKFTVKGKNALKTDRIHTGAAGRKAEPLDNGFRQYSVDFDAEYIDQATWVARHFSDATFQLVMSFVGPLIASTFFETLKITVPAVKIDAGGPPTVDGPDVNDASLSVTVLDDGTNPPIKVEYTSTDTLV